MKRPLTDFKYMKWLKNPKLVSLYRVISLRMTEAEIGTYSSVVAYYLLLSLFPLMISLGSAIGFAQLDSNQVLPYIKELFPNNIYALIEAPIIHIIKDSHDSGLLTIAALVTFWTASKSINGLQRAMNKVYGVNRRRNFIVARLFSFGFMFVMFFFLLILALVFSVGTLVLNYFQHLFHFDPRIVALFATVKWPVTIVVMFLVMLLIYRVVPNARITFKKVVPGTLFTTLCWLLLSQLFGRFAHHLVVKYSSYGIIGTMMILMLWLKLTAIIIIVGGVINAVTTELKEKKIEERSDSIKEALSSGLNYLKNEEKKEEQKKEKLKMKIKKEQITTSQQQEE